MLSDLTIQVVLAAQLRAPAKPTSWLGQWNLREAGQGVAAGPISVPGATWERKVEEGTTIETWSFESVAADVTALAAAIATAEGGGSGDL